MNIRIKDICRFGKKSDIKAGEGNTKGKYMFFTSSIDKDKRIDKFDYDEEGIIMGTGGNATLHYYSGKFAVSTDCLVLLPNSSYKCKYLYYFFLHNMRVLEGGFRGAGLKHTSKSYIENIELTKTHSLLEQDKIISVLSNIDNTIVLQNKRLKLINELTRSLFIEMFGDPISNSKKWTIKRLVELSILITNGTTPSGGSENYIDSGVVFLRSQNVWKNRIDLEDTVYISSSLHKIMNKSRVIYNDILITKTGRINTENSSLGRAAIYKEKNKEANINGHVYLIRLKDTVNPEYILSILTGEAYREYIRRVCVGGIDKRQINLNHVEDFPIIVPPLDLQNRFAEYVSSIDKSKLAVKKSLEELEILKKSLMQKYFV